ncbi:helix-turn-helix domain-containing protein [Rhizobium leguminosarum]|uniref:Helix-turn-helix domain-containing protein n=1 Tax=Rhizobium ruizarguesonis TaxID=2081791 RepID=A0AAE5C6A0_9HYPH|nr:helix-turn-helix transcriptional regulator [Rhizobium ruizarguesonis]NEI52695.1 helix-turn-helix domain-containing protein [Rhizobium ruizarguesonis]
MQVVQFESAKRFKRAQEKAGIQEYSFRDAYELCAFVASEIQASRMNYSKLAEKAGIWPQTVSNIANGITRSPRVSTVLPILKALGFEVFVRG